MDNGRDYRGILCDILLLPDHVLVGDVLRSGEFMINMIPLEHLFDFYSKRHYEFMTAWGLVGQVSALLSFETFAIVFCDKFGIFGLPAIALYIASPIAAVVAVTYMGHKMIQSGYADKYQQYAANVNRDWKGIVKNISAIKKAMNIPETEDE